MNIQLDERERLLRQAFESLPGTKRPAAPRRLTQADIDAAYCEGVRNGVMVLTAIGVLAAGVVCVVVG